MTTPRIPGQNRSDATLPTSIDEVIERLDEIIGWAAVLKNRGGFFAVLYDHVTHAVKAGLAGEHFRNPKMMERLDVVFANRYLAAFMAYSHQPKTISASWRIAFDSLDNESLSILQHLLLGMNAHINLDLAIAAAEVAGKDGIQQLREDFFQITNLLIELTEKVAQTLIEVSPNMYYFYRLGGFGGRVSRSLLRITRGGAWDVAVKIASLDGEMRQKEIEKFDGYVARVAKEIVAPPKLLGLVFKAMGSSESKDVPIILRTMRRQLCPVVTPAEEIAHRAAPSSKPGWTGPTSLWEAVLWVVWPIYLGRRKLFYALCVIAVLIIVGISIWRSIPVGARTRIVDSVLLLLRPGRDAYDGVQLDNQYTTLDLTQVRTVSKEQEDKKVSLAKWKIDLQGTKVAETAELFAHRSGTTSQVDPDFNCNYPSRVVPTRSKVAGTTYRRWDVFANISQVKVEDHFEIVFNVDMWNAFQRNHEDATCSCLHIVPQLTFEVLFPRPTSGHTFFVILQDPKAPRKPFERPNFQLLDGGRRLIWTVKGPLLNHGYCVEWDW